MRSPRLPRREFLIAAGALAAWPAGAYAGQTDDRATVGQTSSYANKTRQGEFPVKVISSANGLQATKRAYQLLADGTDTLEAAIAGVSLVEDDPEDYTVGYGGLPNEEGIVELDAAVMHGPTHRAGAVAALQNIKNPSRVAKLVLERSDHVLLVGEGALRFAKAHGFAEQNLLTEKARKIWLYWKENLSQTDDWLAPPPEDVDPDVAKFFKLKRERKGAKGAKTKTESGGEGNAAAGSKFERPTGTIHCAAMNGKGDISCVTTTSGLAFKIPGRVGDSPIVGAGLYVDNGVGSCGSTGRGEANLQNLCCFAAVELMRHGASSEEAGLEVLRRVAKTTSEKRLLDEQGRPNFGLKFYVLSKDGAHAGVSMWGPSTFAVTDKNGTRLEQCAFLYRKQND